MFYRYCSIFIFLAFGAFFSCLSQQSQKSYYVGVVADSVFAYKGDEINVIRNDGNKFSHYIHVDSGNSIAFNIGKLFENGSSPYLEVSRSYLKEKTDSSIELNSVFNSIIFAFLFNASANMLLSPYISFGAGYFFGSTDLIDNRAVKIIEDASKIDRSGFYSSFGLGLNSRPIKDRIFFGLGYKMRFFSLGSGPAKYNINTKDQSSVTIIEDSDISHCLSLSLKVLLF